MPFLTFIRKPLSLFFEYDTPRIVHIKSKKVGIISRLLQLIIIAYIVGFVLIWEKGYQEVGAIHSTVTHKVKGVAYTKNITYTELGVSQGYEHLYDRIWDPPDYVVTDDGGIFIMTNVIITPNQTRGKCPESSKIAAARCSYDSDCPAGKSLPVGNGVFSGKCVESEKDEKMKVCEIHAWCPVEQDSLPFNGTRPLLQDSEKFTILIKNSIKFLKFGAQYERRNIFEDANATYLQECLYNEVTDPFCPIFKIGDMVSSSRENFSSVATFGAVFEIRISWYCNLDNDFSKYCKPKYSFSRTDSPKSLISAGWNFRSAVYHEENRRTLYKKYGLKFLIKVEGQAGKFDIVPLLLNISSGLALLGISTILCDIVVLYCLKSRHLFKEKKFLTVRGEDAFEVNPHETQPQTQTSSSYTKFPANTSNDDNHSDSE